MAETLGAWIALYAENPKKTEDALRGNPVLLFDTMPSDRSDTDEVLSNSVPITTDDDWSKRFVIVVEKTVDNVFRNRVTIGRTSNNDIVLDDASVSRFHAWLQKSDGSNEWEMVDAGSRNGCSVEGTRLVARVPVSIQSGSMVGLGALELTFLSTVGFLEFLKTCSVLDKK